jgi:hypothetical protein
MSADANTANLIFRMTDREHPIDSPSEATRFAQKVVDRFSEASPDGRWRADEHGEPLETNRLAELLLSDIQDARDAGYLWAIGTGSPPRDLQIVLTAGLNRVFRSGKASLRFQTSEEFQKLENVYVAMSSDPTVDLMHLSVGVDFLLRQPPEFDAQWKRLPVIGWRNLVRRPLNLPVDVVLPHWVKVHVQPTHIELVLGESPFDLDPADAATVRDAMMTAGLL